MKSCRSVPFKCQTSTASAAHKEIFARPWREAKGMWLMFHLTSPPRRPAVPRRPCLCDVRLRAPAGSCSLTARSVCPAGSRTRETKRLKHRAAALGSARQRRGRQHSPPSLTAARPGPGHHHGAPALRPGRTAPQQGPAPGGHKMRLFHTRLASVRER